MYFITTVINMRSVVITFVRVLLFILLVSMRGFILFLSLAVVDVVVLVFLLVFVFVFGLVVVAV